MSTMTRQKFDEDFKKMIVKLHNTGTPVAQQSSEYGIASQTIYKWVKLNTPNKETGMTEAERNQMQKEMARLQEENAILKKALTIIAQK